MATANTSLPLQRPNQNIKNHNNNIITCEMTYKFDTKALCKMIGMLDV